MAESEAAARVLREKPKPVVKPGEFVFSVVGLQHGHIYGMTRALLEAGATLGYVWDSDPNNVAAFQRTFSQARAARCEEEILADAKTQLIASAAVTSERCALGIRAMRAGKDFFSDKAPMTKLSQLGKAREAVRDTGRKYMVYYSERLHSEASVLTGYLIEAGEIGRVLHVEGFGPHRLGTAGRPDWFFEKEKYGGILCDIGSHQIEQYLFYAGEEDAEVGSSRIANYAHPKHPELDDFGDCTLTGAKGTTNYFRVDWFTPDGLSTWGDGRTFILGTEGYIEIRKFVDIASGRAGGDQIYLVNRRGEQHIDASGLTGYPFFGEMILDCLNRTERAMTQAHAFKAAELCLRAQANATAIACAKGF